MDETDVDRLIDLIQILTLLVLAVNAALAARSFTRNAERIERALTAAGVIEISIVAESPDQPEGGKSETQTLSDAPGPN